MSNGSNNAFMEIAQAVLQDYVTTCGVDGLTVQPKEAEIDFIIEENGILYLIEIKLNANVTADVGTKLEFFDDLPEKKCGMGAVVCMCPMLGMLRENVLQFPLKEIRAILDSSDFDAAEAMERLSQRIAENKQIWKGGYGLGSM